MKEAYQLSKQELLKNFGDENGLSSSKVKQQLQTYSENILEGKGKKSTVSVFFEQFAGLKGHVFPVNRKNVTF